MLYVYKLCCEMKIQILKMSAREFATPIMVQSPVMLTPGIATVEITMPSFSDHSHDDRVPEDQIKHYKVNFPCAD